MQMYINHLYTAIYVLKEDIDALYEYMRVLSTQQLNPLIIPPDILHQVLDQSKMELDRMHNSLLVKILHKTFGPIIILLRLPQL